MAFMMGLVGARFGFVFPARAVDAPRGAGLSWRQTRGLGLALFLVLLAYGLLIQAWRFLAIILLAEGPQGTFVAFTWPALSALSVIFFYAVMAAMLAAVAIAYRHNVGLPGDSAPSPEVEGKPPSQ